MKSMILGLLLLSISPLAMAKSGDNGWTSTGGGEYIVTQNNPWFMGKGAVKWCIDHGGEDKFSLTKELAKKEIAKAIENLASQVRSANAHLSNLDHHTASKQFERKCGVAKDKRGQWVKDCNNGIEMSDTFLYTDNCNQADLEFILGNYENTKIKQLISDYGLEKFKKIAGITIRTHYSEKTLRAQGFIYIAADKGEIQYSGARNINIKNTNIWDNAETLSPKAPIPANLSNSFWSKVPDDIKLKNYAMGALIPVVTHEFGHVLGLGHNKLGNLMDEDYPAKVIKTGFDFKGNYLRDSKLFSASLPEDNMNRRISLELNFENHVDAFRLGKYYPFAYDIFVKPSKENYEKENSQAPTRITPKKKVLVVFDTNYTDDMEIFQQQGTLKIFTLDKDNLKYNLAGEYAVKMRREGFTEKASTNLRYNYMPETISQLVFDSKNNKWNETASPSFSVANTTPLITLNDVFYLGVITDKNDSTKTFSFHLYHKYFYETSRMEIFNNRMDDSEKRVNLYFEAGHLGTNPEEKIPSPQPIFSFQ